MTPSFRFVALAAMILLAVEPAAAQLDRLLNRAREAVRERVEDLRDETREVRGDIEALSQDLQDQLGGAGASQEAARLARECEGRVQDGPRFEL